MSWPKPWIVLQATFVPNKTNMSVAKIIARIVYISIS
jgi:hypothetical protein